MRAILLSLAIAFLLPAVAAADQDDPRLDRLFAVLQTTEDTREASVAEQMIWTIWIHSDDERVTDIMRRGIRAMGQQRYGHALELFDELVGQAPEFAEAWNKRATVHYLLGNLEESIADVERTLALEPRHFGALSGLGQIHLLRDEQEAALFAFERALEVHPHLSGARTMSKMLGERLRGRNL
ncbi:MAG: tetratricopeptide repeat protein [Alphaproteobacteria bacterium]